MDGDVAVVHRTQTGRSLSLDDRVNVADWHDVDVHTDLYTIHGIKTCVRDATRDAIVSRLSDRERVVEIGIGRQPAVARALAAAGLDVTATDIHERAVPDGVTFVHDDVTDPDRAVYTGADALYACNLPPELQRPALSIAREVDASFLFTT
ncbi:MAG: hypothetical protein BRD21_02615, partial [Halobacteriales archaeon SW_8_66_22]